MVSILVSTSEPFQSLSVLWISSIFLLYTYTVLFSADPQGTWRGYHRFDCVDTQCAHLFFSWTMWDLLLLPWTLPKNEDRIFHRCFIPKTPGILSFFLPFFKDPLLPLSDDGTLALISISPNNWLVREYGSLAFNYHTFRVFFFLCQGQGFEFFFHRDLVCHCFLNEWTWNVLPTWIGENF